MKALLSLGVVLGVGSVGTSAFFTDQATVSSGGFTTGTLDLTLDQGVVTPNATIGQGGAVAKTTLAIASMVPGESVAADVLVKNNDGVPFTYRASGRLEAGSTFPTAAPVSLTFAVHVGTASNSGTQVAGNRTGGCSGAVLFAAAPLSSTAQDVISTARTLASNGAENICILVRLDPQADNAYQNRTASATFVFRAAQAGQTP